MTTAYSNCIGFADPKPGLLTIALGFTSELSQVFGIPKPDRGKHRESLSRVQEVNVYGDASGEGVGGYSMALDLVTVKPFSKKELAGMRWKTDSLILEIISARHCIQTALNSSGDALQGRTLVYNGENQHAIALLTGGPTKTISSKSYRHALQQIQQEVEQVHSMASKAGVNIVFRWHRKTTMVIKFADRLSRLATRAKIVAQDLDGYAQYVRGEFSSALVLWYLILYQGRAVIITAQVIVYKILGHSISHTSWHAPSQRFLIQDIPGSSPC